MKEKKIKHEWEFFAFMGSCGSTIPIRHLPPSARKALERSKQHKASKRDSSQSVGGLQDAQS